MTEEKKKSGGVSRREFLKDAGLLVGGTAIGSTVLLAACSDGETVTEKVTTTITGAGEATTKTITTTEQVGEVTKTETITQSKFVCPIDGMEFDTLEELKAHFEATHGGEAPAAALNVISLTVNGGKYEVQVKPHWTLQYLLHDEMGCVEIKTMCTGLGQCGSCSVIMDGRPILSCMTLAATCDGAVIETSVGIAQSNHPLIESYIKYHCMQCGYCTPGFLVTAKALLDKNPNPTKEEIELAIEGNLCRCSTYPAHVPAVLEAAEVLKGGA